MLDGPSLGAGSFSWCSLQNLRNYIYAVEQRNKNFFLSVPIIGNQNGVDKKARKSLNSEYESGSTAPLVGSF
jgi:hypothetical protein